MSPKLIVISGGPQGATFELPDEEISIGREAANRVCLVDPSVSRRHALLKREGDSFKIVDLESLNGILVNDVPISERQLEHGDRVAIGDILILFLLRELDSDPTVRAVNFAEDNLATRSLVLRRQDAFYLSDEKVLAALSPSERVARDLHTLLKISTAVNSAHDMLQMQKCLLELIFEVVPAEHGAIVLAKSSAELTHSTSYVRHAGDTNPIVVSRTVATQALRERVSILIKDVSADSSFAQAPSLIASEARSILCSPLTVHDEVEGVIYLDTRDPSVTFDEHHLQLLMAIAGIAALAIQSLRSAEKLATENLRLSEELNIKHTMIGESSRMRDLYRFIAKVAPSEASVLLRGESGTGKELAARAIHTNGSRANGPFVAINCATLSETLLESELFGHEKGAFTGAIGLKRGKLEIADRGTLFLDEVGELSPTIQAKLLRVLQEREFERVGGTRSIKIDIRVVAATNRDLETDIRDGKFRQDLYYRLNVISFTLPALRDRREDIPLLANYFANESSRRAGRRTVRLSTEARSYLLGYAWPGNVRELQNVIERAVVLGSTDMILAEDLPEAILEEAAATGASITTFYDALRETKKRLILNALRESGGNFTEAARQLGIHPNNLHRLVRTMNIKTSRDT
jgi:Nif-specific regulatory protein